MTRFPCRKRGVVAFTLVELLVVLAIISLLIGLFQPAIGQAIRKAQSIQCVSNLRAIGAAAALAATDNNNLYPEINQTAPPLPYPATVQGLVGVLGPYGITTNTTQCPTDMAGSGSSFSLYGSSYEWNPVFDDENPNNTVVYFSSTRMIPVNSSRVRLSMDFNRIHNGRSNTIFGDGHVSFR